MSLQIFTNACWYGSIYLVHPIPHPPPPNSMKSNKSVFGPFFAGKSRILLVTCLKYDTMWNYFISDREISD